MKLRVATCRPLPEPDPDEEPLAAALAAAGFEAEHLAWDDPRADWDAPIPTIIRATWNYARQLDRYRAWLARVAATAPLFNPLDVVLDNLHKRYLLALAARGVPVVPTQLVEPGARADLGVADKLVIKPEIGAGSLDARVFTGGDPAAHAHIARIHERCAALVQPYVASVETYGERSLVWIDGALSHAIRKTPRFAGDAERVDGPFPIADDERAVAEAALAPYASEPTGEQVPLGCGALLYGRVDLARDDAGRPMVMELELVEPSLFFAKQPGSAERYVSGLRARLST